MNHLYYGDCLTIMQEWPLDYVDLIYLDPPFNSNRSYNAIYKDETGRPLPDQVEAFCDMWELDRERERAIKHMPILLRENGIDDATAQFWKLWMNALRDTRPNLLAYLSYMVERLLIMKRILKPTGSIYLHCDQTASHYIKIMMDGIFGHDNFCNEIVWCYTSRPQPKSNFGKKHDTILFYKKSLSGYFDWKAVARPLLESTVKKYRLEDDDGRKYRLQGRGIKDSPIKSQKDVPVRWEIERPDLVVRDYLDEKEGTTQEDWWIDIPILNQNSNERMGIETQKPLALMDRIINASCPSGGVVLDPFCGCGTTVEAAQTLGRKWIGIDIAIHAIKRVSSVRLENRLGLKNGKDFIIQGVPRNLEGAQDLWERDKYHFQKWAVEQVDGFVTSKKSNDGGIDGRIYIRQNWQSKDLDSMVLEVKGGKNVSINDVRSLKGVLDNDHALMAGLIVMEKLSGRKLTNFKSFMAQTGDLTIDGFDYPKMQLLSVEEIFEGKRFITPSVVGKTDNQPSKLSGWDTVQAHNL